MNKWIECERLNEFIIRILRSEIDLGLKYRWNKGFYLIQGLLDNIKSLTQSFYIGNAHYDIGNDLFEKMLDKRMRYSCGYRNRVF